MNTIIERTDDGKYYLNLNELEKIKNITISNNNGEIKIKNKKTKKEIDFGRINENQEFIEIRDVADFLMEMVKLNTK